LDQPTEIAPFHSSFRDGDIMQGSPTPELEKQDSSESNLIGRTHPSARFAPISNMEHIKNLWVANNRHQAGVPLGLHKAVWNSSSWIRVTIRPGSSQPARSRSQPMRGRIGLPAFHPQFLPEWQDRRCTPRPKPANTSLDDRPYDNGP